MTTTTQTADYGAFRRLLWRGTLVTDALLLALAAAFRPAWLPWLAIGMGMGLLYVATLTLNAARPASKYLQIAISLTRVAITAYCIAWITHAQSTPAMLVIIGCFSYKGVVTVYTFNRVMRGLQTKSYGRTALDR